VGWDKDGRYYTRSRKVNGRVVREYCGRGSLGQICARIDADRRAQREAERAAWQEEKARLEALEVQVESLCRLADLLSRAALVAAGIHQHKRQWRKKRGQRSE
jgi:cob(I)alamin adenosyltransferase